MPFAITTKYLPPTAARPARISARMGDFRAVISYPLRETGEGAHRSAAMAVLRKAGGGTVLKPGGELPDCKGWVFITLSMTGRR